MKHNKWIALGALPIGLGFLYSLDLLLERIQQVESDFIFLRLLLIPIINVLYVAVVFSLLWLVTQSSSRWVRNFYLFAGIALLFYPALRMTILSYAPVSVRTFLPYSATLFDAERGLLLSGAFVVGIAILATIQSKSE